MNGKNGEWQDEEDHSTVVMMMQKSSQHWEMAMVWVLAQSVYRWLLISLSHICPVIWSHKHVLGNFVLVVCCPIKARFLRPGYTPRRVLDSNGVLHHSAHRSCPDYSAIQQAQFLSIANPASEMRTSYIRFSTNWKDIKGYTEECKIPLRSFLHWFAFDVERLLPKSAKFRWNEVP